MYTIGACTLPNGCKYRIVSAGAPRYSKATEWEYVDPKGVIQGPFSSKEVLKWSDAGFFQPDQQVRTAECVIQVDLPFTESPQVKTGPVNVRKVASACAKVVLHQAISSL